MDANDAYEELGVEEFEIIETLDGTTCEVCGELDGKHFPKSEYKIGVTVPPFHPWCRGCTAPYFEDMKGISTRFARDIKTGKAYEVPNDMTFAEWKKRQDEKYGEGTVDTVRKMSYNNSADKSQYDKYKQVLGKDAPKKFDDFRNIKYFEPEKYAELKDSYIKSEGLQKQLQYIFNGEKLFIPNHSKFDNTKVIAGSGSDTQIRVVDKLVEKYGGEPSDWKKKVGKITSEKYIFDVHWYEKDGRQYETKLKYRKERKL